MTKLLEEVKVFCDVNILFKIDNKAKIRELEKAGIITIASSQSMGDEWLNIWARDHENYIVTNDNYGEWVEEFQNLKKG